MRAADRLTDFALARPRLIAGAMAVSTLLIVLLALLPSLWPRAFPFLPPVQVDTDPENMLAAGEPVRVFHHEAKREFDLRDIVVVGVVNETDPQGVFNQATLDRIHDLTAFIRTLRWSDPATGAMRGVVAADVLALSTVDDIRQAGLGAVEFSWLMREPPATQEQALEIRERARRIPLLDGTVVSADGRATAIYVPLTHKDLSYRVREAVLRHVADWPAEDQVHVAGLPVAEDTFGVEMFYQMAISAPLAMLAIFLLMWFFFRHWLLITAPMIVAMVSALAAMGLLIASGHTIHIMSSMIPIFVMPISVLDAVHILSEFFDSYPRFNDRRAAIRDVMTRLFQPMLYTSLTTTAGFASLALTPIPPVQVFGVFVAIGVMLAWLWSVTFIPAFVLFIPESKLAGFGHGSAPGASAETPLGRALRVLGAFATARHRLLIAASFVALTAAIFGISRIQINDNPTKWFTSPHPIRVADRVLNGHFAGTYTAYLELRPAADAGITADGLAAELRDRANQAGGEVELAAALREVAAMAEAQRSAGGESLLASLQEAASMRAGEAGATSFVWEEVWLVLDQVRARDEIFKQPEVLNWMLGLQRHLERNGIVGKVNGLPDIVRTVHRELLLGDESAFRIPDRAEAVAQTLLTFQNSHRPQDLWHFVTPDYRKANLWLQLKSGDNRDMERVIADVAAYLGANSPPLALEADWFGLTYVNVVWQQKMVTGMLHAFLGSFAVVLLMMIVLFRSILWGLLSMIPLTVTVALIYGIIGFIGKDYDMPVAVLSALSLGLAVDYAIHFLARSRDVQARLGSWAAAVRAVFGEPARAITRNAVVLGAGFLPLLAAPLVPYRTVGIFIAAIILSAGLITLLLLPALIRALERRLFTAAVEEAKP